MIKKKFLEFGADFSLVLVAIAWGATFFIVQDAVEETPVYVFLFWRFFLASILMILLSYRSWKKFDKATLKAGIILGCFMFFGFAFQTFGLTYTYSSTVAFITGLNVVMVPFIVYVFFKKNVSIYSVFGAICAVGGLYLLTDNEHLGGLGYGELYSLICALMFALHISFTDGFTKKYDPFLLVSIQFAVVALFSFFGAITFEGEIMPNSFDGIFMQALIITVVFATIFAFFAQTYMQQFTTPAKTAIIFTMEPVSGGVFGYYFANEIFGFNQIAGAICIVSGMLIAELGTYMRNKRQKKKALYK